MQVLLTGRIFINVYFEEHVQPYATEKEKRRNGSVIFFLLLGAKVWPLSGISDVLVPWTARRQ